MVKTTFESMKKNVAQILRSSGPLKVPIRMIVALGNNTVS